ncbi:MAG TPA: glycosyltransferase family 4 protein [Steroidobacteraceae bacterium]|nr:glycosyltransferase family 4 protein [Steroidobacteraceae bacterium]
MLKLAVFSTLFPNAANPAHGVFVEERLRKLVASGQVQARVVAPVPWFPFRSERFGEYGRFARAPQSEERHGLKVVHPRYFLLPRVGMNSAPWFLARAALPALQRMRAEGFAFDAIDAHYFYPDGVAAAELARRFDVPLVVTARGSDVTLLPRYALPRRMILETARHAAGIVTVCGALKDGLVELGVQPDKITVLRNGVDLERFRPAARDDVRRELGLAGRVLLSVGWLITRKRHDLAIRALPRLPDCHLVIIGTGPEERALHALAEHLEVRNRVRFLGHVPQSELYRYYTAADVLLLCSEREGWANVLLEAMACGTPVAATDVGGTGELVTTPAAGVLIREHSATAVADAVRALLAAYPSREATRRYAEQFSWDQTTQGQLQIFRAVLAREHAPAAERAA